MFRYFIFIFFISTSFPQSEDERFILIEAQKILAYMSTLDQISLEQAAEFAVASNVANSVARSINVVMNAYHLIHIYNIIQGEEDKIKVGEYLGKQIPRTSKLLEIEVKLSTRFTLSNKSKGIKDITESYINSLNFVIKLLNDFS